jgi:hypothetical protein
MVWELIAPGACQHCEGKYVNEPPLSADPRLNHLGSPSQRTCSPAPGLKLTPETFTMVQLPHPAEVPLFEVLIDRGGGAGVVLFDSADRGDWPPALTVMVHE